MGCCGSSEEKAPPPKPAPAASKYQPPPPPSGEEMARRQREAEEEKRWMEIAKAQHRPEPPKAVLPPGATAEQYKDFMRQKYEHENWENELLLMARRMRAAGGAPGGART